MKRAVAPMRHALLTIPLYSALLACRSTASSDPEISTSPTSSERSCDASPIIAEAEDALRSTGHPGAVVVLDLKTGEELAVVDTRTDPPLVPPGSTMKPLIAMAAVQGGVIDPQERLSCDGSWQHGDHTLTCFHRHGPLDLPGALATSCNVYGYEMAARLGPDRIADALDRLGLTGIASFVRASTEGDRYLETALGHGDAAVTPIELAHAYSVLLADDDPALAPIRTGMLDAVTTAHGTARAASVADLDVAGKTGTAEHDAKNHAWFVGFAPAADPTVLVLAYVEGGDADTGGSIAAPVAGRVLRAWTATDC